MSNHSAAAARKGNPIPDYKIDLNSLQIELKDLQSELKEIKEGLDARDYRKDPDAYDLSSFRFCGRFPAIEDFPNSELFPTKTEILREGELIVAWYKKQIKKLAAAARKGNPIPDHRGMEKTRR